MRTAGSATDADASMTGTAAVEVRDLVKTYGPVRALDGLDLSVAPGEIHGLLGPNGAGKSTAIRILLGLARPDSGTATILGAHPARDAVAVHARLAYVPGDVALWPNLTGGEAVDVLTRLRGTPDRAGVERLARAFDLDLRKKCRAYSKGNRQKVALVAALSGRAELLVLDEPTSGLDPLMEQVFQEEVRAARDRGTAVLLSSHILGQVEALVDRVSVIRDGKRLDTGTLAELRHLTRTSVDATVARAPDAALAELDGVHDLAIEPVDDAGVDTGPAGDADAGAPGGGTTTRVRCAVDAEAMDDVVRALSALGVRSLVAHPPTLEQMLLRYYAAEEAER